MQPVASSVSHPAARDLRRRARLWLLIALASSVLCLSLALGVGGAIFCHLAQQASAQGLHADAQAKLRWGQILTVAGSVLGALTVILTLILR